MEPGKIIVYTASAGSGKTHTLTGEYLLRLFKNPVAYKRILAVTFTNKAAAEMKGRILDELAAIAAGRETKMLKELSVKLGISHEDMKNTASVLLPSILADYSAFSVGTIDSFFQKVFRAFTREIGIQSNFSLYIDSKIILHESIDDLINELDNNEELRKWLGRYASALFREGQRIDIAGSIFKLAKSAFSEHYMLLPEEKKNKLADLSAMADFVSGLEKLAGSFRCRLRKLGQEAVAILEYYNIEDDLLRGGHNGVGGYLRRIASGEVKEPSSNVIKALDDGKWHSAKADASLSEMLLSAGIHDTVAAIANMMQGEYPGYLTARLILDKIYLAAILSDVMNAVRRRTNAENSFLLDDTGNLLRKVIGNDQTPFIYEKTGNRYDIFMIDEFQDTSMIQYLNFRPLLENSLSENHDCIVVGDIKQSIYRWRNGEWTILGRLLGRDFGRTRLRKESLLTNWRSLQAVVLFNNSLFSALPGILDEHLLEPVKQHESIVPPQCLSLSEIYSDVRQNLPHDRNGGYVRISFLPEEEKEKEKEREKKERILKELPAIIMQCQDDGYRASDIGILLRTRDEGSDVMNYLNDFYRSLPESDASRYNFSMLSGESLKVGSSPSVRFIVALLVRLIDPGNALNRSEMLRYYLLSLKPGDIGITDISVTALDSEEERVYPPASGEFLVSLVYKPLFTICEEAIDFFGLNTEGSDMASISFFQDQVLEYMLRRGSGLKAFTDWWLEQGCEESVTLSGEQDSINIMTIHKAKGLQFRIVIIPFITWTFDQQSDNILWLTPSDPPFSEAGAFPLGYAQNLVPTLFGTDYFNEKSSSFLDNLNLLYVAFTRARERLYGFSYVGNKNNAGAILKKGLLSSNPGTDRTISLKDYFDEGQGIFEYGFMSLNRASVEGIHPVPAAYPVYDEQRRLNLRLYGKDILKEGSGGLKSRMGYGMVLHEILGRIHVAEDVSIAVDEAVRKGFISRANAEETKALIYAMLAKPEAKAWFDPDSIVLTEQDILTGCGEVRRPDRVVIRDGEVSLVDYKFGQKRQEHKRQMEQYRTLLTEMGYRVRETCLWYVEEDLIVRI